MTANVVDYVVTRYYRLKDKFIWLLWKFDLTDTVPASELDLSDLMDRAELLDKLG
jgi:hypothetical protein